MKIGVRGVEAIGDLGDRLNGARLVVDVHHADQQRVGAKRRQNGAGIDDASLVRRDERDVEPAAAQLLERLEHGMVLDRRRHDVPPVARGRRQAQNRQVVAFRRAARENHIPAAARDDGGDAVAGLFDGGPGATPELMRAAAGIAEVLVQVPQHLGADPRIQRGRRGTIEIDSHRRHHDARERRRDQARSGRTAYARMGAVSVRRIRSAREPLPMLAGDPARGRGRTEQRARRRRELRRLPRRRVPVLRRFSGGGAVVLGPGCLNYAVVLSLVSWPELTNVAASFHVILGRIVAALGISGLSIAGGTDLVLDGRKVRETRNGADAAR